MGFASSISSTIIRSTAKIVEGSSKKNFLIPVSSVSFNYKYTNNSSLLQKSFHSFAKNGEDKFGYNNVPTRFVSSSSNNKRYVVK